MSVSNAVTAGHNLRGIAFMLVGSGILTCNDAVMKWLTGSYPTGQLLFIRGTLALLPILLLAWRTGGMRVLRVRDWRGQLLRAACVVGSTYMFITGLRYLELADAVSIAFANPLFLTALAPLVVGESVGWRRWTAVLVGFAGVLIITRPGGDTLGWAVLFPLGAALGGAMRDLLTRKLTSGETSLAVLMVTTVLVALSGLVTWPFSDWQSIQGGHFALMALSGGLMAAAHWFLIEAFRYGEAVVVAPFKYSSLLFAMVVGFLVWGYLPDVWVLVGAAVVAASGLYILHREMQVRRRAAARPGPAMPEGR